MHRIDAQGRARPMKGDGELARLATRQHGVVSRAQLAELGIARGAIARRVASGRLLVVHRGVYAVGHAALTFHGRALAALLAAGPDAVLSHRSAAVLWELARPDGGPIEVTVAAGGRRSRAGLRVHRTSAWRLSEVRVRDRIRVTAPARTLLDLAATCSSRELERLCAEATVLGHADQRDLAAAVGDAAGRRGSGSLRSIIAEGVAPTRSRFERELRAAIAAAGLPRPEVGARVGRFTVDFLWREERVVVETDGWRAHGHRLAFENDRARDAELHALGHAVLRFTWRQLKHDLDRVIARIAQVIALRRAA